MKKKDKEELIKWANSLSDEELEKKYYESVYDSLGSQTEEMYERGYDLRDIEEREKYEKYLDEKSSILENLCDKRGIRLWENNTEQVSKEENLDENQETELSQLRKDIDEEVSPSVNLPHRRGGR